MGFRVEDFQDLLRLLQERPEWRVELRRVVLTDELLAMPEQLARFREESEQRFQALAQAIEALTARVGGLAGQMETLTAQVSSLTTQVSSLTTQVSTLAGHVDAVRGDVLERRYQTRAFAYFAPLLRRPHALTPDETMSLLEEAVERGLLARDEAHQLSQADVIVHGRNPADGSPLYLVVEVSVGIGVHDVTRATERAALLTRTGVTARPVVAGEWMTPDAIQAARDLRVWQLLDGRPVAPAA